MRSIRSTNTKAEVYVRDTKAETFNMETLAWAHLVQGKPVKIIAQALGSKESTVRVQRHRIYGKMQADSPTDLLRMMTLLEADAAGP